MPAKDIYHDTVRTALEKDDWIITHDPLIIRWGKRDLYIDLGAQKLIAAEKDNQKIAIEIKSFISKSPINDLEKALGQYILYYDLLAKLQSERILYLAIDKETYIDVFEDPIGQVLLENKRGHFTMDTLDNMRQIIIDSLGYYADIPYGIGEVNRLLIIDKNSDNYLILLEGWENQRRVHGCLVHLQIINGKIWIQRDGIEDGIATDLLEAGIPKDKIVLAFKSEHIRHYTEFAVK